jgi:hypothetical protein
MLFYEIVLLFNSPRGQKSRDLVMTAPIKSGI